MSNNDFVWLTHHPYAVIGWGAVFVIGCLVLAYGNAPRRRK